MVFTCAFHFFIVFYVLIKHFGNGRNVWLVIFGISVLMNLFRGFFPKMNLAYLPYVYEYMWSFAYGAIIYKMKIEDISSISASILAIVGIVLTAFCVYTDNQTMIATLLLVTIAYIYIGNHQNGLFEKISQNSFGLYLFHSPLIYITFLYFRNSSPLIVAFVNFILFGALSFVITESIRRTVFKFMIGE